MMHINDELYRLQQQSAQAAHLREVIPQLQLRHQQLTADIRDLKKAVRQKQRDVDRLEGWSLSALYYRSTGTLNAQLDKERRESCAIQSKYDTAVAELAAVEADLRQREAELAELDGCEERYAALLAEKLAIVKNAGGETAENILRMEARIAKLDTQKEEVRQAIAAGNSAFNALNRAKAHLDSSENWNYLDIASTGALTGLFDLSKHSEVEEARAYAHQFISKLNTFQSKLACLSVTTRIQISVEDLHYLTGHFFDGYCSERAFREKLKTARSEVDSVTNKLGQTIARLEALKAKLSTDQEKTRSKLDKLVLKVK